MTAYSTQHGALCPICFQPVKNCRCRPLQPKGDGIVRVARATQGRKGAGVTTVTGLAMNQDELKALAKELKRICGSGGTLRDGVIEVQGEHRDRIVMELQRRGITAKKAGG
ncbi:MAG: translation initiation factor Sui1 [Planctomycetes bacterium]|nr:translation initiation factor Sui1 [Planctomycetota bacterium]MCB9909062.1 translation initiation factor Sui1 [Planctomycetota bacterium]MCB9911691.1 translation initiation factor Sui1 [Planctomycetota bacterium]HPF13212.1 translation initiation factor Sui1 [Planctomycetota bacterium]HRV82389.1 translation initiation factor Sui1 [Planctomycetota bacterium]